ncbi:hypothetical protein C3488_34270 [Streptomyces sp. Ru72]|nr:hypothetical protein C3488_34270 [Streptomyces sp. Ru72]
MIAALAGSLSFRQPSGEDDLSAAPGRRGVKHVLLDFVHVAEYVWTAPMPSTNPAPPRPRPWAADRLTAILSGHAVRAAAEKAAQAEREQLSASRREACRCYLTGPLDQLHYDTDAPQRVADHHRRGRERP